MGGKIADELPPIVKRRSCTDIPCLAVFIGFVIGWFVVAGIAMRSGSLQRLLNPSDSHGLICGTDAEVRDKPYLLFFDLTKCARPSAALVGCATPQMCVAECPDSYFFGVLPPLPPAVLGAARMAPGAGHLTPVLEQQTEAQLRARLRYCLPHTNMSLPYATLVDGYHCAPWHVPSGPLAGRCVPKQVSSAAGRLANLSQNLYHDLAGSLNFRLDGGGENDTVGVTLPPPPPGKALSSDGTGISATVLKAGANAISQMRYIVSNAGVITASCLGVPVALSLLFLVLMRFFVGPVIWLSLIGLVLALLGVTAFCGLRYAFYANLIDKDDMERAGASVTGLVNQTSGYSPFNMSAVSSPLNMSSVYDAMNFTAVEESLESGLGEEAGRLVRRPGFWLAMALVSGIVSLVVIVIVIALRKKIRLAVALLKHCSTAMADMCTVMLVPVASFALQLLPTALFVLVAMYLASRVHEWRVQGPCECTEFPEGHLCYPDDFARHCGAACPNATCRTTQTFYIHAYNVAALVWCTAFAKALDQIAVALAFVTWYFSSSKRLSYLLPLRAYLLAVLFHAGTAAFGSLLIAICALIRYVIEFAKSRTGAKSSSIQRCLYCSCTVCFCMLERCIKFINKRAYIITALDSVGLCVAGRRGMAVVLRNIARVGVTDSVTALCLFLGRVLVVVGSVFLVRLILSHADAEPVPWVLPTVFSVIVAYVVAGTVFSVYSMGVDTVFYCAMVDLDTNDGSPAKPYMMSTSLAKALGVQNQSRSGSAKGRRADTPASESSLTNISAAPNRGQPPAGQDFSLPSQVK